VSEPTQQGSHEWSRIKRDLAGLEGKQIDGDIFQWRSSARVDAPDFLVLGDVAASFHSNRDIDFYVCFRRRPPESGNRWPGASRVPLVTWFLEPLIKGRAFAWVVREDSETDDPAKPVNLSPAARADWREAVSRRKNSPNKSRPGSCSITKTTETVRGPRKYSAPRGSLSGYPL
jgi:hypothetical protein